MSRTLVFSQNEFYHIYNRGTEKRIIFSIKADYERFIALLYLCNGIENIHLNNLPRLSLAERLLSDQTDPIVNIVAYCLMPNHFHLMLQERVDKGISRFMQKVITGYTMYFNKRNERTGVLFQGKFKATHANQENFLNQYPHSSYLDYCGKKRLEEKIINKEALPEYFSSVNNFKTITRDWLEYRPLTEVRPR